MKILHTADWHIGKKLYKYDLYQDFDYFIDWLVQLVEKEQIQVILVCGDIFDAANPSVEARKQFYKALVALQKLNCKLIITAGNHDAPSVLNAPKDLIKQLDIDLIGNLPNDISDCIIPLKNNQKTEVVVAAIPFLRDSELRKLSDGTTHQQRLKAVQDGIERIFAQAFEYCQEQFPEIPVIAMGHLFVAGNIATSDSEREIQIGNQALLDTQKIQNHFRYIALGHIHKPQRVSAHIPIFYSGSPIPLSFSERKDIKRVLLIDTEKGFEPQSIEIPQFRELLSIRGNLSEIRQKINELQPQTPLISLLEVTLIESVYSAQIEDQFIRFVNDFSHSKFQIVKPRMEFADKINSISDLNYTHQRLSDLKPQEVFVKLLEKSPYEASVREELLEAFGMLLEQVNADL